MHDSESSIAVSGGTTDVDTVAAARLDTCRTHRGFGFRVQKG
jgi:hypothetical protein